MFAEHLTRAELVAVLELVQASLACTSDEDVRDVIRRLKDLIPYQAALSAVTKGHGSGPAPLSTLRVVNVDYPEEYLGELARRGLIAHDPVVASHFRDFRMQHWADTLRPDAVRRAEPVREILGLAHDFGFTRIHDGWGYAYGVRGGNGSGASLVCFHGLPRCPRTEEILRLLVPHLHEALRRSEGPRRPGSPLTPRETEVLRWVGEGKTTWDISEILSISERTVKFHVANAVQKLGANTRAHAVAIAYERRLFDAE